MLEQISPLNNPPYLAASSYQLNNTADKQLAASFSQVSEEIERLPIRVAKEWKHCLIGHIQHFGFRKVETWAARAATKREPERYLMRILSEERYGRR